MSSEFIAPNWHVILIHYPIALLTLGVLIELFSFLWRRSGFRAAGRWMLLLGTVLAVPAVISGLYALNDVAQMRIPEEDRPMTWHAKAAASGLTDQSWELLVDHLRLMSISTAIAVLVVVLWLACSDQWRRRLHIPLLIAMLVAVGLLISGAWHSGEAVYRQAVGVQSVYHPAGQEVASVPDVSRDQGAVESQPTRHDVIYYLPPLQAHTVLAGLLVAVALVALGLSIRAAVTYGGTIQRVSDDSLEAYAQRSTADETAAFTGRPEVPAYQEVPSPPPARVPSARFWLLAFLLGLLTAAAGIWFLALDSHTWDAKQLWEIVWALQRRLAHVITGVNIVVLTLILSALARWAPRQKFLLSIFALLLVVGVVLQLWFGILLLFDGQQGELTRFDKTEAALVNPGNVPTTMPVPTTAPVIP